MIKWLNSGVGDPIEPVLSLPAAAQLQVTPTGHVNGSDLYQVLQAEPFAPATRDAMLLAMRSRVNHTPSVPAVQIISQSAANPFVTENFSFMTEPGLSLTAQLLIPQTSGRKPAKRFIQTDSLDSLAAKTWAQSGNVALTLMPRGLPSNVDPADPAGDFLANLRAMLVGRDLPSMRAYDILQAVDVLSSRSDVDPAQISATANGVAGVWLLLAAAVDSRLSGISLDHTPPSLRAALLGPVQQDLHDAIIPWFARYWDLMDLALSVAPRTVNWTNPTDWLANVVSFPACSYDLSGVSSYSFQGGAANIIVGAGPGCSWSAKSNATWIVITSPSSGTGNGSVSITVDRNALASSRTGTLSIAGQTFTIIEAARQTGDFDGNGVPDLVWMNSTTREVHVNYFGGAGGASLIGWNALFTAPGWHVGAVADFDRNGVPDLVWVNDQTNEVHVLYYGGPGGATLIGFNVLYAAGFTSGWHIVGAGDFNGDEVPDLVWQNDTTDQVNVNYFGGTGGASLIGWNVLYSPGFANGWRAAAIADFNGDGVPDVLWQNTTTAQVNVNYFGGSGGASLTGFNVLYSPGFATGWHIIGALDMDNNGTPDVLWENDTTGQVNVNYFGGPGGATLIGFNVLYPAGFTSGWTLK
jgi:hypothetical protein